MVNSLSIADLTAKYEIDVATALILERYLFDPIIFDLNMDRIKLNGFDRSKNYLKRPSTVPENKDLEQMPPRGSNEYTQLKKIGEEAFLNGEVLSVVLAGGMATRFGGGIKALAPIFEGLSFGSTPEEIKTALFHPRSPNVPAHLRLPPIKTEQLIYRQIDPHLHSLHQHQKMKTV